MQLRNLKQSYNELKSYNAVHGPTAHAQQNTTGVIGQQAERINELQDEVRDLQVSLREFSTQLTSARADSEKHLVSVQPVTFCGTCRLGYGDHSLLMATRCSYFQTPSPFTLPGGLNTSSGMVACPNVA